ncbi:MAG: DUF1795 domain-containing protein [Firmicutes bacterium]|nr:DUF1795 domain-containing protein [Bacillota bacterium]
MKRISFCLILLVIGLLLISCGQKEKEVSVTAGNTEVTMTIPGGWAERDAMGTEGVLLYYRKDRSSVMLRKEPYTDAEADLGTTAQEYIDDNYNTVQFLEDMAEATVGGKEAKKFLFNCKVGTFQMTYQYLVFKLDGEVYALTYSSLKDTYAEHLPDFEALLATVQFSR